MKAYMAQVSNREDSLFIPEYMSMSQLPDKVAIVVVNDKEVYFDPGQRYCPFGHLAWQHTYTGGVRQTDGGAMMIQTTPGPSYKDSVMQRAADLTMDKDGSIHGTVTLLYTGTPALALRQAALRTDETGMHERLKTTLERMLPAGLDIEVKKIDKLTDYDGKLAVLYDVKGNLGSITGKRVILPADPFTVNDKAVFTTEKRQLAIDFNYPYEKQDAARFTFPAGDKVESSPAGGQDLYKKSALNSLTTQTTPTSITVHWNEVMAEVLVPVGEYPQLKAYYSKLEQREQENVVLNISGANSGN
jgi:hypothetical protein